MKTKLLRNSMLALSLATLFSTAANAFTAVTSGNWSSAATWGGTAPGSNVNNNDIIIPAGFTVNLDVDVHFSGLLNNFTVNGTLTDISTHTVSMDQGAFNGSGSTTIQRLAFTSSLATNSYTGTMLVHSFINDGSTLTLSAVTDVMDTLDMRNGGMSLGSGSNLTVRNSGIIRVDKGSITNGGGIFNTTSGYSVLYVGTSKSTGIEFNAASINNIYVNLSDNSQTLTLGSDVIVYGATRLQSGTMDFSGRKLTLMGDFVQQSGAVLTSSNTSDLDIESTTALTSGFVFSNGSAMRDFTINTGAALTVKLMSQLNLKGHLILTKGICSLENGSSLNLASASIVRMNGGSISNSGGGTFNGALAYNVEYTGSNGGNSGIELGGAGLNDVTLNMSNGSGNLSLSNDLIVRGQLKMQNGNMTFNGKKLTLMGDFVQQGSSSMTSNSTSDLDIESTAAITSGLVFSNGSSMRDFTINTGSAITTKLMSQLTIQGHLILSKGICSLESGSSLILASGSIIRIDGGSLHNNNGGTFTGAAAYSVEYISSADHTSGLELTGSALTNVLVNMSNSSNKMILAADAVIYGQLKLQSGNMDFSGKKLTLIGDFVQQGGAVLTSNGTSDLDIENTTAFTSGLVFSTGSAMRNFTVNNSSSSATKLMSTLTVQGHLILSKGTTSLESGSSLILASGSTITMNGGSLSNSNGGVLNGALLYNVEYTGYNNSNSGIELGGAGLNDVTVNMGNSNSSLTLSNDLIVKGKLSMQHGNMDFNGKSLTLNGTLSQVYNSKFMGNSNSDLNLNLSAINIDTMYFDTTKNMLRKVTVNLALASKIVLGSSMAVVNEMDMQKGKMDAFNSDLIIMSTASITNYDNNKYIVTSGTGRLQMYVNANSAYTQYPVGSNSDYAPASIQQTSLGTSGYFMVKAANGVLAQGTGGIDLSATHSMVNKTWYIDAASGVNVNLNMKLAWVASCESNGFARASAFISHYKNSNWDSYAAGSASVSSYGTFELSRGGITSLSPFAVGDNNSSLAAENINAAASEMNLYPNPTVDGYVNIRNSSTDPCLYQVIDMTGKVVISQSNAENDTKFNVSSLENGYYIMKITNLSNQTSVTKSFVKAL